ncbi:MAG TPA: SDR family oxidoreductase [Pirellulales bacterium]|jgi:NAD(P)-dependent dehydrogenase (short-subunit alcohol dehydrogenase family)|nr:SDR family oxidoreductase [Pirellulales bacterium]
MTTAASTEGMLKPGSFSGQTIVITGGGTGLGRAMGRYLLELGANLVICGRRADVIAQAAAELQHETGGQVLARACDVRMVEQVESLLDAAAARFGSVQGLVNNAAGNFICPTERLSFNAFHTVVDIVLRGSINCTLAQGKRWVAAGSGGVFLNIVATYAETGSAFVVPSAVAKSGVLSLTRSLAAEWGRYGIRSNAIAPGPFPTEGAWSRLMPGELAAQFNPAQHVPLGRVGEHQELANLAAYLLSGFSAFVNGACFTIDGGESVQSAGEFNYLSSLTSEQWDALQARLKPKKPAGDAPAPSGDKQ